MRRVLELGVLGTTSDLLPTHGADTGRLRGPATGDVDRSGLGVGNG